MTKCPAQEPTCPAGFSFSYWIFLRAFLLLLHHCAARAQNTFNLSKPPVWLASLESTFPELVFQLLAFHLPVILCAIIVTNCSPLTEKRPQLPGVSNLAQDLGQTYGSFVCKVNGIIKWNDIHDDTFNKCWVCKCKSRWPGKMAPRFIIQR